MISEILSKVKSPFTDELIQELIEKYIECGCDDRLFYNEVNKIEDNHQTISGDVTLLINKIFTQGISKNELWNYRNEDNIELVYDNNDTWMVLYSNEDPMEEGKKTPDNKSPLLYRIYLNLKDKQKAKFIEDYIRRCKESKIPFELKFSKDDSRLDQIVILSKSENLEENILTVEELTKDLQLGNLPMLIGKYKDKIGIAEEYHNRLYSPTKAKLALIRSVIKKYLCDNIDELEDQLSYEEKEKIKEYIYDFKILYDFETETKNYLGSEYQDFNKSYYQEKSTIDCAKEHIENDHNAYVYGTGLLDLGNAIKKIYLNNKQQFISQIIENYRLIGTKVWGFSENFIFSNETEKKYLKSKELSANQIGAELGVLSRKGIIDSVQKDLISIFEEKDVTKEIKE